MLYFYVFLAVNCTILRLFLIFSRKRTSLRREANDTCSLAIFLGSGGHTSEALALLSSLDFSRYTPRTYIISKGDHLSAQKASALELSRSSSPECLNQYSILTIPRARQVHQSLLTTPYTAIISFLACLYYVVVAPMIFPKGHQAVSVDALLLNGPGTSFFLGLAAFTKKFFGLPTPKVIYIESFARVKSLSLSGKLLHPLVDRFLVQWPQLLQDKGGGEYYGWLV